MIRTEGSLNSNIPCSAADLTRQVAYWQRFRMWSDYHLEAHEGPVGDSVRGPSACLIWRCQAEAKESFYRAFTGEGGKKLLSHPMLVHAFFLESIVVHAYDFLKHFSGLMYQWVGDHYIMGCSPPIESIVWIFSLSGIQENKAGELRTPDDYTARSRAFLTLSRRIYQIVTDIDILTASIDHLREQSNFLRGYTEEKLMNGYEWRTAHEIELAQLRIAQSMLDDIFDNLAKEVKLVNTYATLYLQRSKLCVEENFAMINQRDSEVSRQTSTIRCYPGTASNARSCDRSIFKLLPNPAPSPSPRIKTTVLFDSFRFWPWYSYLVHWSAASSAWDSSPLRQVLRGERVHLPLATNGGFTSRLQCRWRQQSWWWWFFIRKSMRPPQCSFQNFLCLTRRHSFSRKTQNWDLNQWAIVNCRMHTDRHFIAWIYQRCYTRGLTRPSSLALESHVINSFASFNQSTRFRHLIFVVIFNIFVRWTLFYLIYFVWLFFINMHTCSLIQYKHFIWKNCFIVWWQFQLCHGRMPIARVA